MFDKVRKYLAGKDVFVSYSREDGEVYASNLAIRLADRGLTCFLDQYAGEANQAIPRGVLRELDRASMLVLVGSPRAAKSGAVRQEVASFVPSGRPVCPITFSPEEGRADFGDLLPGLAFAEQSADDLGAGLPTDDVLDRVEATAGFQRQATRQRRATRLVGLTLAAFVFALGVVGVGIFTAKRELDQASVELEQVQVRVSNANLVARAQEQADVVEANAILASAEPAVAPNAQALQYVHRLSQTRMPTWVLPTNDIYHLAFHPERALLLTKGESTSLWDAREKHLLREFAKTESARFMNNPRFLQLIDESKRLQIFDLDELKVVASLAIPKLPGSVEVKSTRRGTFLLVVTQEHGETRFEWVTSNVGNDIPWEVADHRTIRGTALDVHLRKGGIVRALTYTGNDRVWYWNLTTGASMPLPEISPTATSRIHPDRELVVSAFGNTIDLWDASGMAAKRLARKKLPGDEETEALFFHDIRGEAIAVADRLWRLSTDDPFELEAFAESRDGQTLIVDPDGEALLQITHRDEVKTWSFDTRLDHLVAHYATVESAEFMARRNRLVTSTAASDIFIWDFEKPESTIYAKGPRYLVEKLHHPGAPRIAAHPRLNLIASWSTKDPRARLWDMDTGAAPFKVSSGSSLAVFSPDGQHFADLNTGTIYKLGLPPTAEFELPGLEGARMARYSPDGKFVAAEHELRNDNTVARLSLWEVATKHLWWSIELDEHPLHFSFDSQNAVLAVVGKDEIRQFAVARAASFSHYALPKDSTLFFGNPSDGAAQCFTQPEDYDVVTVWAPNFPAKLPEYKHSTGFLGCSVDERRRILALLDSDLVVHFRNPEDPEKILRPPVDLSKELQDFYDVSFRFGPRGEHLVFEDVTKSLLVPLTSSGPAKEMDGAIALATDGPWIAQQSSEGLRLLARSASQPDVTLWEGGGNSVFSPRGDYLLTQSYDSSGREDVDLFSLRWRDLIGYLATRGTQLKVGADN